MHLRCLDAPPARAEAGAGTRGGAPMPDADATIAEADAELQEQLAESLELRAADPAQRAMFDAYTPARPPGRRCACSRSAAAPARSRGSEGCRAWRARGRPVAVLRRPGEGARSGPSDRVRPRRRPRPRPPVRGVRRGHLPYGVVSCPGLRAGTRRGASRAASGRPARGLRRGLRDDDDGAQRARPDPELRGRRARDAGPRPVADAADRAAARPPRLRRRGPPRPQLRLGRGARSTSSRSSTGARRRSWPTGRSGRSSATR